MKRTKRKISVKNPHWVLIEYGTLSLQCVPRNGSIHLRTCASPLAVGGTPPTKKQTNKNKKALLKNKKKYFFGHLSNPLYAIHLKNETNIFATHFHFYEKYLLCSKLPEGLNVQKNWYCWTTYNKNWHLSFQLSTFVVVMCY
jgi:hypothetical protein